MPGEIRLRNDLLCIELSGTLNYGPIMCWVSGTLNSVLLVYSLDSKLRRSLSNYFSLDFINLAIEKRRTKLRCFQWIHFSHCCENVVRPCRRFHHHHHRVARPWQDIAISTSLRHLKRSCARFHAELRPRLCFWRLFRRFPVQPLPLCLD